MMSKETNNKNQVKDSELKKIKELIETIQYGSVTIVVQDSKVIQIEKNEKIRFT